MIRKRQRLIDARRHPVRILNIRRKKQAELLVLSGSIFFDMKIFICEEEKYEASMILNMYRKILKY